MLFCGSLFGLVINIYLYLRDKKTKLIVALKIIDIEKIK